MKNFILHVKPDAMPSPHDKHECDAFIRQLAQQLSLTFKNATATPEFTSVRVIGAEGDIRCGVASCLGLKDDAPIESKATIKLLPDSTRETVWPCVHPDFAA